MRLAVAAMAALVATTLVYAEEPIRDWGNVWHNAPVERKSALFDAFFTGLRAQVNASPTDTPENSAIKVAYRTCYERENFTFSRINDLVSEKYSKSYNRCFTPAVETRAVIEDICKPYTVSLNIPPPPIENPCG